MNIEDVWTTDNTKIEIFLTIMSLQQFCSLLRSMRLGYIHTRAERKLEDKFTSFRKFFEKFVDNCTSNLMSQTLRQLIKCWLPLEGNVHLGCTFQVSQQNMA